MVSTNLQYQLKIAIKQKSTVLFSVLRHCGEEDLGIKDMDGGTRSRFNDLAADQRAHEQAGFANPIDIEESEQYFPISKDRS